MKITIGKEDQNTIRVDSRYVTVSRNHAEIEYTSDGRFLFIDHSANGTMINNQRIHNGTMYVTPRDRIVLANAYEISWQEIMSKVPHSRPTMERNNYADTGRETNRYAGLTSGDMMNDYGNNMGGGISHAAVSDMSEEDLGKWNWGGFLLNWVWSMGNSVWWGLLALLPGINFIVSIILGIRGTRDAWEAKRSSMTAQQFKESQRKWTIAGLIVWGASLLLSFAIIIATAAVL